MKIIEKLAPVFVVVALVALGASGYFYLQYHNSQKELVRIKNDPSVLQQAAAQETKELLATVGKLMILPSGEVPTIATVTDVSKLKGQEFFSKAKNGDKIIVYATSKKAILYDPSINKIVDVEPISIGSSSAQTNVTPAKIVLYNGTSVVGLTDAIEKKLKGKFNNINFVSKSNASKNDYDSTLVIDLAGTNSSGVAQIAQVMGWQTATLPDSEDKPSNADILVIIGKKN